MHYLFGVALFLASGCVGPPASLRSVPGDPLEGLAWMAGVWVSEAEGARTVELWLPPEGGTMLGLSRTTAEGRTVHHEALRLEARDGAIVYVASPVGQETAELTLVSRGEGRAVFENAAHDYPQRIAYDREGEHLTARIELLDGTRASSWSFTRSGLH